MSGRNWCGGNLPQHANGLPQSVPFESQFFDQLLNLDGVLSNPNQGIWFPKGLACGVQRFALLQPSEHVGERDSESIRDSGDAHHGHPWLLGTFEVAEVGPVHAYVLARSHLAPASLFSQIPNPLAEAT